MAATQKNTSYFPGNEWATLSPADAGWRTDAIDAALDYARQRLSSGVVMLKHGKIVVEHYWPLPDLEASLPAAAATAGKNMLYGYTPLGYPLEDVASLQKSVVAILAAVAHSKGLIDYDAPVGQYLGEQWANLTPQQCRKVTVRHIMTMTSGLNDSLEYEAKPGAKWHYNTPAYQNLLRILARVSGMDSDALTQAWLAARIGMRDTRWVERTWAGLEPPMMGLVTTPRDLARLGLLVLRHGNWQGEQVVPAGELDTLLEPSQSLNPNYAMLWWLNSGNGTIDAQGQFTPGRRIPAAPANMITAAGALNRLVFVLPTEDAVIVRTGVVDPRQGATFARTWWESLSRMF